MNLKEQINSDFKEAFKAKEEVRLSVLKMVKAAISNVEIEKKGKGEDTELSDEEIMDVLSREAKKRKDAAAAFEDGDRPEMAEQERKEAEVLAAYLPEQMGEDEIRDLVKKTIESVGATSLQDLGKVMGALKAQTQGKADGAVVSGMVREVLG